MANISGETGLLHNNPISNSFTSYQDLWNDSSPAALSMNISPVLELQLPIETPLN